MKSTQTSENDHRNLNRMDFLRLFILGGGAAFLSACKRTLSLPSPTPSATLHPTVTKIHTPTIKPKFTPMQTSTTTSTQTPTPTITTTPTETPTLTETLKPSFHFISKATTRYDGNVSWQNGKWNGIHTDGGTVEVFHDEELGDVLKFIVTRDTMGTVRVQLDKLGPPIKSPFEISLPVKLSKNYKSRGGSPNLLSVFNFDTVHYDPKIGKDFSLLTMVNMDSSNNLLCHVFPPMVKKGDRQNPVSYSTNFKLSPGKWYTVIISCDGSSLSLFCNRKLVKVCDLLENSVPQITNIHGGAYGDKLTPNEYILNGAIEIKAWS